MASGTSSGSERPSKGFGKRLASVFKSPAVERRTQVLVETVEQAERDESDDHSTIDGFKKSSGESDKEKVKRVVQQRDASSPSGSFVLGTYKPAWASQGNAGYYGAKAAGGRA